jgi:glyoxylase-like metal-dependent hydrolase (beta-lactamase superfamily II)
MENYICETCGTQYPASYRPPEHCPICDDDRQYVGWQGQKWTTLGALQSNHTNNLKLEEPSLTGIGTEPGFAIGQRAQLVQTPGFNVLWECITVLDKATENAVRALGGIQAIAISHPHYYSSMVAWALAFGAPIYLHAADRQWVMRPDPAIVFWEGETQVLAPGVTLVRCGGHFPGSTVLHWAAGADGRGALLTGDTLMVASDRRYVSFMYSFPNYLPLSASSVRRVAAAVEPFAFDRIYGAWWNRVVAVDAKAVVARSVERYIRALESA